MLQIDQETWLRSGIRLVDKHAALHEQRLEALQHNIDDRFEQRVTGRHKLRLRLAEHDVLLEGDAGIAIQHGIGAADDTIALL